MWLHIRKMMRVHWLLSGNSKTIPMHLLVDIDALFIPLIWVAISPWMIINRKDDMNINNPSLWVASSATDLSMLVNKLRWFLCVWIGFVGFWTMFEVRSWYQGKDYFGKVGIGWQQIYLFFQILSLQIEAIDMMDACRQSH